MTIQRQRYYARNNLRGLTSEPMKGPCTQACVDYTIQELKPILRRNGCLRPAWSEFYGLSGLMGALAPPAGSHLRTGFEYDYNMATNPADIGDETNYISSALSYYLDDGVTLRNVRVTVQPRGWYAKGYITVEADTLIDLPDANVFGDMVRYGIEQYLPKIQWTRRDETLIDAYGPSRQTAQTQQQQTQQTRTQTQTQQTPLAPGECSLSRQGFGDWVACQLGIKSTVGGLTAGATGTLIGVGVFALVVVMLKR